MVRCFLPSIINEDKVIYLDVDTIVDSDLRELWETNLSSNYLGARFETEEYFNSGVLLMNLPLMKTCKDKLFKLLTKCKFVFPDQDALNIVCKNRTTKLPNKFNVLGRLCDCGENEIIIRHYAGIVKPWKKHAAKEDIQLWNKYKIDKIT